MIIDSTIEYAAIPDAADDYLAAAKYLSMDPDAIATPYTNANLEDLEVFFNHVYDVQSQTGAAGTATLINSQNKILRFHESCPLLLGTNPSQVVVGDGTIANTFITTVYFKRRRANALELNQILLKRR